jgi:hypothetical protein
MAPQWAIHRQQLVFDAASAQELADKIAQRGNPPGIPLPAGSVLVLTAGGNGGSGLSAGRVTIAC